MFTLKFGDYTFPNQTFEVEESPFASNLKEETIVRKHGAIIQYPYIKARKFKIKGFIHNSDGDDSRDELSQMQQALYANENWLQYMEGRKIKCFARNFKIKYTRGTDKRVVDVDIQLVSQSPFLTATGATMINQYNLTDGCTFEINLGGNAFAEPTFDFVAESGAITDGISLTNITNDDMHFRWRGTVADTKTLKINSNTFEAKNDVYEGLTYFEGYFITLVAGTNLFQFGGDACSLIIGRKSRWY